MFEAEGAKSIAFRSALIIADSCISGYNIILVVMSLCLFYWYIKWPEAGPRVTKSSWSRKRCFLELLFLSSICEKERAGHDVARPVCY